ncbi:MAG: hypothetical protein GX801_05540 [Fibrobacter sp.]|nr:hypothetical protein [Fibrobacter sp.]
MPKKNSPITLVYIIILFFGANWSFATDSSCFPFFHNQDIMVDIKVTALTHDFDTENFTISWKHRPSISLDTFHIVGKNFDLWYITNKQARFLIDSHKNSKRALASHHLRESIANTILRFDDLELLAHGNYECTPSKNEDNFYYSTNKSQMWYSLSIDNHKLPNTGEFSGFLRTKRSIQFLDWTNFPKIKNAIPGKIILDESYMNASIFIESVLILPVLNGKTKQLYKAWSIQLD